MSGNSCTIKKCSKINTFRAITVKEKQYVIDGLKKFIDDREALDAEIPSDNYEEESSDEKELKKGLCR